MRYLTLIWALVPCLFAGDEVLLEIPEGDALRGKTAFTELTCTVCHLVEGHGDLPQPIATEPGPDLGPEQRALSRGALASAIIAQSHKTSSAQEKRFEEVFGGMKNFSEAMTVQQLIDLVAFLQAEPESP